MSPPMPTTRRWPQTLLLTALSLLIAAATIMLACGPVAQPAPDDGDTLAAMPQVEGGSEEPEEPTDTPTPEPMNNYPNLDASLQDLVRKFESGDLTECQAAAQDLAHHASSVLVEVELSANVDAVDTWMANQGISPRHKDATWAPPHIYAYVPVSLLGALSWREGVSLIRLSSSIFTDSRDSSEKVSCGSGASGAGGGSGAGGASGASETAEPQLPLWLKGVHPYPRLGTGSKLGDVVYRYEQGEITAAAAAAELGFSGGTSVDVNIELESDPDNTEAVATWLRDNGTSLGLVIKGDRGGANQITGSVPLSLLGELSNRPGVLRVYVTSSTGPPGPQGMALELPPKSPTPTPQGFAAHNVAPWHTAGYTGSGIKVGIIDTL